MRQGAAANEFNHKRRMQCLSSIVMNSRSKLKIIESVLSDGRPHSAYDLATIIAVEKYGGSDKVGHGLRIGARIWELRHEKGMEIKSWKDPNNAQKQIYQYIAPTKKLTLFSQ